MKTREQLEQIAREIFCGIVENCRESLQNEVDDIQCSKNWIEEITRVQDEALNSVLPSETTIEAEAIARFGNPETKINSEDLQWWRYKDAFKQGAEWLRANLRTPK